jgi:ABC-type antimicrobial peptide transport system permease subunit
VLRTVDDNPLAFEVLPLDEAIALQMYPLTVASWIGMLLSGVALALSVSGLYGVITYGISHRRKEIGIRMALGATSGRVLRLVMRQCVRLSAWGVAAGLAVAFATMKLLSSVIQMRNVSVVDAGAFAVATCVVSAAAALAAYIPARRATRINPSQALRANL